MPTVLVVHPGLRHLRGARLAPWRGVLRALGLRLVLADSPAASAERGLFDSVLDLPPPEDVEGGWQVLRRFLDRHAVDAVFAQTEAGLLLGALAIERLGVRGPPVEAAYLCTDKHACRRALARAGVPQPRFALVSGAEEARRAAREVTGFPLVLKGVCSARQRLVTFVEREEDLADAVARLARGLPESLDVARLASFARARGLELSCDPRRQFLVESFERGDALECDGLVVGREVASFGVLEQVHAARPRFFIEGYLLPADRPEPETLLAERVARQALAALGLADTGYSIELRSRGSEVALIEVNGRLGIDEGFGDLFQTAIGHQPVLLAAKLCLGRSAAFRPTGARAAVAYRSCYEAGRVESVPAPAHLAALRGEGLRAGISVARGDRVHAWSHPHVAPHLAFVLASDPRSSRAAYERARGAVQALPIEVAHARSAGPHRSGASPPSSFSLPGRASRAGRA